MAMHCNLQVAAHQEIDPRVRRMPVPPDTHPSPQPPST